MLTWQVFSHSPKDNSVFYKGFLFPELRWVGWRNESLRGRPLEIVFQFSEPREFNAVHIHVNERPAQGAKVSLYLLQAARLFFLTEQHVQLWKCDELYERGK